MSERVLKPSEPAYKNMVAVAALLEATSKHNAEYVVRDVYIDYGQDWMWTTICRRGYNDCQVLSPREWEEIVIADSIEEICKCAIDVQEGDWFGDK